MSSLDHMLSDMSTVRVAPGKVVYVDNAETVVEKPRVKILRLEIWNNAGEIFFEHVLRPNEDMAFPSGMCKLERVHGGYVYVNMNYVVEVEPYTLVEWSETDDLGRVLKREYLIEDDSELTFKSRSKDNL